MDVSARVCGASIFSFSKTKTKVGNIKKILLRPLSFPFLSPLCNLWEGWSHKTDELLLNRKEGPGNKTMKYEGRSSTDQTPIRPPGIDTDNSR